jgi:FdhD protein
MAVYNPLKGRQVVLLADSTKLREFEVGPSLSDPRLTRRVAGRDETGAPIDTTVTMLTIGGHPKWLAGGYILNQNMLRQDDRLECVDYNDKLDLVVVRTERPTNYEAKLRKENTNVGLRSRHRVWRSDRDIRRRHAGSQRRHSHVLARRIDQENQHPAQFVSQSRCHSWPCSLAPRQAAALSRRCRAVQRRRQDLGYMFLNNVTPEDKIFYATGRLTSEMVIKCVNMRILSLVSGSGFTAWGLDLAGQGNLTLIGRARGRRFFALSGHDHIICDPVTTARDEGPACKGAQ